MNRVADKNRNLAATRCRGTAVCGRGVGASSPHQRFAYREPMSSARRATQVAAATRYWRSRPFAGVAACCHSRTSRFAHRVMAAVIPRCQGARRCEHLFLSQPARALAVQAVCGVMLPAKARSRHVTAQQPFAGATAGDHSRTCRSAHRVMVATIRVVAFLASHPEQPSARSCET